MYIPSLRLVIPQHKYDALNSEEKEIVNVLIRQLQSPTTSILDRSDAEDRLSEIFQLQKHTVPMDKQEQKKLKRKQRREKKKAAKRLEEIERLMTLDPDPESAEGQKLKKLAADQEAYEKKTLENATKE